MHKIILQTGSTCVATNLFQMCEHVLYTNARIRHKQHINRAHQTSKNPHTHRYSLQPTIPLCGARPNAARRHVYVATSSSSSSGCEYCALCVSVCCVFVCNCVCVCDYLHCNIYVLAVRCCGSVSVPLCCTGLLQLYTYTKPCWPCIDHYSQR